jgi:hypothetical protein
MEKYGSETRLLENQIYTVRLVLKNQEFETSFTSKYNPLYSNVRIIRGDYKELFAGHSDDEINMLIYQNSLNAIELANPAIDPTDTIPTYVKQYVRYKTELDLITDIAMTQSVNVGEDAKTLDNMTIQKTRYAPNIAAMLKVAKERLAAWESLLYGMVARPTGAVRAGGTDFPLNARIF